MSEIKVIDETTPFARFSLLATGRFLTFLRIAVLTIRLR